MTSRAVFALAAIGLAAAAAPSAHGAITLTNGQSVSLLSILQSTDHQVNIGDKTFTITQFTSAVFAAGAVSFTAYVAPNPNDGIGFDLTGGFADVIPGDTNISEFNLLYTVEVQPAFLAQGYRLKDVGLLYNGNATGPGSYSRVDESVFDPFGVPGQNLLTTLTAASFGAGTSTLQDYRDFSPNRYTALQVNKDVKFFAAGTGSATASFVRQTFSQVIVPAPGSAALLGLGGLVALRRRRA